MATIDTDKFSARLRERSIRRDSGQLLISRLSGSDQEFDLSEPPNCGGFGRIRHFRQETVQPWPKNSLPIWPASERLGLTPRSVMRAQVFQNASCNWRCWYCYVPYKLLSANEATAAWLTAEQMVDLYLAETDRPLIIDCSGGQPDLVPEWIPWMMRALRSRGVSESVYLWSDDNLSNGYFWEFLDQEDRNLIASYPLYGRVCCFKGFSAESFAFNTKADSELFERQFVMFKQLLSLGIDLYAYATFTAPVDVGVESNMSAFVDRLQGIHPRLPLRLIPLKVESFGVVEPRLNETHHRALAVQELAVEAWNAEIAKRFNQDERTIPIQNVNIVS